MKHLFKKGNKINKGRIPWNKGKTKETDIRITSISENLKGRRINKDTEFKKGHEVSKRSIEFLKNRDCSGKNHPNWQGGKTPESERRLHNKKWKRISKEMRNKFKECQCCKSKKDLIVHHKIPYMISRDDSEGNLLVLCRHCHGVIEWEYSKRATENAASTGEISKIVIGDYH